ncbi:MAG TPA: hypothetical protein VNJ02_06235 [Vicinamibacterales bacterium]|nr:hypothetical protein [Vicinamibacterales bacterium]
MAARSFAVPLRFVVACVALLGLFASAEFSTVRVAARQPAVAAPATPALTLEEKEAFLKKAKIVRTRGAGKGVTGTLRATLSDGTVTHDASIQTVDEYIREFRSNRGTELNFRDSWRYNVAAYRIDRVLQINMTPPSVERNYNGKAGAFTWWVDDVLMDEAARLKEKTPTPDVDAWNRQMWQVRLFDQLIANVDRNLGNLLIDKAWTVWMIDHSRAFRLNDKVKAPGNLTKCERVVFERLKALDLPTLKATVEDYLTGSEMRAMLQRRDEIVALIEKAGPAALYDRPAP